MQLGKLAYRAVEQLTSDELDVRARECQKWFLDLSDIVKERKPANPTVFAAAEALQNKKFSYFLSLGQIADFESARRRRHHSLLNADEAELERLAADLQSRLSDDKKANKPFDIDDYKRLVSIMKTTKDEAELARTKAEFQSRSNDDTNASKLCDIDAYKWTVSAIKSSKEKVEDPKKQDFINRNLTAIGMSEDDDLRPPGTFAKAKRAYLSVKATKLDSAIRGERIPLMCEVLRELGRNAHYKK